MQHPPIPTCSAPIPCSLHLASVWHVAQRWFAGNRRLLVLRNYQKLSAVTQVLCASDASHEKVDPIAAPEGVPVGERVMVSG